MRSIKIGSLVVLAFWLSSCSGYRLGGKKPEPLEHVNKLHVPLAKNSTQIPRAGALVTNGVVDALVRDGTYRLGTAENADATLEVEFYRVNFAAIRSASANSLRSEELSMTVEFRWRVIDGDNPLKVLDSGSSLSLIHI